METVNIHEAKTHLSRLIDKAVKGEPFIIAKAGKPLVRVEAVADAPTMKRTGFLVDAEWVIPEDFDRWAEDEIAVLFGAKP